MREDNVEGHQSTGRTVTALTKVFEQGVGLSNNTLCLQPSNHEIKQGNESSLTFKQPNQILGFSKKHNLEKINLGINKEKKKNVLLLNSVMHYNKASISYPGYS